jgi:hypothetical protein
LLELRHFTDETCFKLLAVRNCRIMSAPNIGIDQVGASAEQPSQGAKRSADTALDEPTGNKTARHTNAAAAQSSLHGSLKRSATEALPPSNSSDEAPGAAGSKPSKKKQRNKNIEQLLPPSAPQASCLKRSASEALAVADLESKAKKHMSKNKSKSLAAAQHQQQQQQQTVGSDNNSSISKNSLWAFVETALSAKKLMLVTMKQSTRMCHLITLRFWIA